MDRISKVRFPQWLQSVDPKTTTCKKCGQRIFFGTTKNDKKIPMNVPAEDEDKRGDVYVSHFSTCTFAEDFRKTDDDGT